MQVLTVFFAAFLALVASQCNSGVTVGAGCACLSGYTGSVCTVNGTEGCTFPTVAPLVTSRVAELVVGQSEIKNNKFVFVVESPASSGRYFTQISLAGNSSCSYPNAPVAKTFNLCKDVYTGNFSIPEVKACGFVQDDTPTETTLTGSIAVTAIDPVATFRGTPITRTTTSALRVKLVLPRTRTLTTGNLTVISPIEILSAVTLQEYNPGTDDATIVITTSVQWPYILTFAQTLQIPNINLTASVPTTSGVGADCLSTSGACLQTTTISLNEVTNSGVCNFDGTLRLQWNSNCRTIPTGCPINGADVHDVSATIVSGNLCPVFEVVSSLEGNLFAFTSTAFSAQTISFVANQPVFLGIFLTSSVNILSIQVIQVTVIVNGVPNVIVAGRNAQSGFGAINYQPNVGSLSTNDASTLGFSFVATYGDSSAIFLSSGSSVQVFTVQTVLSITYVTSFKRDMLTEDLTITKDLVLDASRI